jgi:hypothetical protein
MPAAPWAAHDISASGSPGSRLVGERSGSHYFLRSQLVASREAEWSRHLRKFTDYYHGSRTHLSLQKDTPESRPVPAPEAGRIVAIPEVGGLHHRYERRAA